MPGPLPTENPRRRNSPTIPTTKLPAGGRTDPAPDVPDWVELGRAGWAWWSWAWSTPQASAWAGGHELVAARRAQLEDDLAALSDVEGLDLVSVGEPESDAEARKVVQRVAALATGRLQIMKHMLDLDDRLGFTPKAMSALRWTVVADEPKADPQPSGGGARARLRVVDPDEAVAQ